MRRLQLQKIWYVVLTPAFISCRLLVAGCNSRSSEHKCYGPHNLDHHLVIATTQLTRADLAHYLTSRLIVAACVVELVRNYNHQHLGRENSNPRAGIFLFSLGRGSCTVDTSSCGKPSRFSSPSCNTGCQAFMAKSSLMLGGKILRIN